LAAQFDGLARLWLASSAVQPPPRVNVLGTPLEVTDYDTWIARCKELARLDRVTAVEFANTQIVTLRRHDAAFHELSTCYDYFIPDGMPLVWCLNRRGARLTDRVYGPTFMRRFLETSPDTLRHYLLGGSEECGRRLRALMIERNPRLKIVGSCHGIFDTDGRLKGNNDALVDEINRLSPDFIWVGLGTPKQDAWLYRHKHRLKRGVVLSVGFAFDVNAGTKSDAPAGMQRIGLTWLYRLASEPRRLLIRYLRYNSLFIWYLCRDGLCGRAVTPAA
jgi:N-acetylglucosaminyldiphosphoundecaprenol N-acetyl-beta-D-mannosaminyltransferase